MSKRPPPDGFALPPRRKAPAFTSDFHPRPQQPPTRPLRPPVLPPTAKPPVAKPLKPLAPPVVASTPRKEILTHVARPIDLQLATILNAPPKVETRGIELSPEKGKAKYVRSGLASHAFKFYAQSETSLALWQKDVRKHAPDMQVKIIKILVPPSSNSAPTFALCEITGPYESRQLQKVLFSSSKSSNCQAFQHGQCISIWKPWQAVNTSWELPSSSLPDDVPVDSAILVCSKFIYGNQQ